MVYQLSTIQNQHLVLLRKFETLSTKVLVMPLKCSSPIPIFSQRFVEALQDKLRQEIEFIPCKVICNNIPYDFYVGRILNFLPLIDKEKSEYYELSEGEKIMDIPVFSSSVSTDFYIARDNEEKNLYAITDKMKEVLTEHNFNIKLKGV